MGFSDSNIFSKIALIVLPVGGLFIIVGLSTNSWYEYELSFLGIDIKTTSGLWRACGRNTCKDITADLPDWWKATRAFVILGVLFAAAGICLFLLSIIKSDVKALRTAAVFLPFAAGLCTFIGVGVYGGKYFDAVAASPKIQDVIKLSWSFALTAVGGVISVIAGIIWIISIVVS